MNLTKARTWAEIDLSALAHNYHKLRSYAPDSKFLGVCKADGYGHGATQIAKKLEELGAEMLAVASLEEGISLREGGVACPILCFGETHPSYATLLLKHNITQTVTSFSMAAQLAKVALTENQTLTVHIKLETGMGRLGILQNPVDQVEKILSLRGLRCEGLFTHLACADEEEGRDFTEQQFEKFQQVRDTLASRGVEFELCHMANSGATLDHPKTHLDMVRPGIALYGYPHNKIPDLKPVLTLKSVVASIRTLPKGHPIGYGGTQCLDRMSKIAVLPVGYADGYDRKFSNGMEVLIHDTLCPVVGRVCMDMCMVDVTEIPDVVAGDIAILYGEMDLLLQGAERSGTVSYELLCRISPRVPRIYVE